MKTTAVEKTKKHVKNGERLLNHKKMFTPFELLFTFFIRQTESDRRLKLFGNDPLKS